MSLRRATLVGCLLAVLAGCSNTANTKTESRSTGASPEATHDDRLFGVWKMKKAAATGPVQGTLQLTEDGRALANNKVLEGGTAPPAAQIDEHQNREGSYRRDSDNLLLTFAGETERLKIIKLTDRELILRDNQGNEVQYEKR